MVEDASVGERSNTNENDAILPVFEIVDVVNQSKSSCTDSNTAKQPKKQTSLFTLYRYAGPLDVLLMLLGIASGIGSGVIMPLFINSMGGIIDSFSYDSIYSAWFSSSGSLTNNSFTSNINNNVHKLLYFGAINCVLQFIIIFACNLSAQRQCNIIRNKYFENAMAQEVGWFDKTQTGVLVAVITNIQQIQSGIGSPVSTIVSNISTFICVFILGFIKGWKMTLVIVCLVPILMIVVGVSGNTASKEIIKAIITQEEAGMIAGEIISSIRTVTAFSIQDKALERYNNANKKIKTAGCTRGKAMGVLFGGTNFVMFGFIGLAFWYGSSLVTNRKLSPGGVFVVLMSVVMSASSLSSIGPTLNSIFEACGAGYKVFEVIDRKSAIDARNEEGEMIDVKGGIEFKDVTFRYPTRPDVIVLKNFNLKIKKGHTVALVGSSGSGKSTVASLLERFYDIEDGFGTVYIDGHDIKALNLKNYRSQIGIVTQEPVLFATTIAQNIAYGYNGEATQELIEAAAKEANAHDFIMKLPDGYNTLVGERGTQLSGGQKQRISIARALIRKPKILIFDEATSALDTESERVVQKSIDEVAANRTCIIIAHRLSTVRNADRIVVIHKGSVIEKGTHDELMKLGGMYKTLIESQQVKGQKTSSSKRNVRLNPETKEQTNVKKKDGDKKHHETKVVKESPRPEKCIRHKLGTVLRAFKLLKGDPVFMFLEVAFSLLNGALVPIEAVLISEVMTLIIYDPKYADIIGMTQEERDNRIIYWALGYVALGVASFVFNFFQFFFSYATAERLTHYIRYEYFKAMMRQETGWFDDKNNMAGILTTKLASDPMQIHSLTCTHVGTLLQIVASLVVSIVVGFIGYWKVALVVLATVPVKVTANVLQMRSMLNFGQRMREAYEQCGGIASEALQSIRTVASLGRESSFLDSYASELASPDNIFLKSTLENAIGTAFNSLCQFWVSALAFWYGGIVVERGESDFNGIMKAQMAITMGTQYLGSLTSYFPSYSKAIAAAQSIFQLLDRNPSIPTPTTMRPNAMKSVCDVLSPGVNAPIPHLMPCKEDGKIYARVAGKIEFRDVHFSYPTRPDQEILKGLTLVPKPKQTLALVGESGCGKSTIISLIERFYLPTEGKILLDGHPINDLEVEWFRSQIGLVSQEPVLFATSIRENIRYGKSDATEAEIIEAAKKANAHTFIAGFPDGYDTVVGEKGVTLSGGQKQRIAIARALVRNPKILLLDEATSALDAESERVVQEALDKAREGRTTIVIAHRLSTIKGADVILVLEKGVIVEKGKHEELLELNGLYSDLVKAQTQV